MVKWFLKKPGYFICISCHVICPVYYTLLARLERQIAKEIQYNSHVWNTDVWNVPMHGKYFQFLAHSPHIMLKRSTLVWDTGVCKVLMCGSLSSLPLGAYLLHLSGNSRKMKNILLLSIK